MKIFQLIDWLTKLFKLNNRSKIILLILLPLPIFSQNNAFWLGKRTAGTPTNLLLDDYPGAAVAYSVRKLDKDYTGFAMEIRRQSDNATQNIGFVGEDLDEVAINSFCSGTNCYVRTWYDQSGNNYNLSSSGNPVYIYISNQVVKTGNNPSLQFATSNVNQIVNLVNTSLTLTQPYTILGVAENTSISDRQMILTSNLYSGTTLSNFGAVITTNTLEIYAGVYLTAKSDYTTQRFVLAGLYNGVNSSTKFNNNIVNTGNTGTNNFNGIVIGGLPASVNNEYAFIGKISEIVIYNTNNSSNYGGLFSNINSYYSIY